MTQLLSHGEKKQQNVTQHRQRYCKTFETKIKKKLMIISTKITIFLVTIRTYGTLIENFIDQHNFRTEDNEIHCSKF